MDDGKLFRIPDKDVRLFPHEVAVTQTRTFQRLFHLKQLGLAYLVYPYATHTRAAHSISCLDEATNILFAIEVRDGTDFEDVRMAALLHDIGHVPFSHTLEDEHVVLGQHDKSERLPKVLECLKRELPSELKERVDRAAEILYGIVEFNGRKHEWKSDLVGNTVCADLLAYITVDARWTGIEKRPGYYRMYKYLARKDNRLCIKLMTKGGLRQDIVSAILDLLDMRYALFERVTYHHAKCIASAMLARAARLCNLTDATTIKEGGRHRQLYEVGDERFLDFLESRTYETDLNEVDALGARRLLEGLRSRKLYKRIFKIERGSRESWDAQRRDAEGASPFCDLWRKRTFVEEQLALVEKRAQIPTGSLALWCPPARASMKEAKALVIWNDGKKLAGPRELRDLKLFPGVHERVEAIERQYLDLWTFWVGMDAGHLDKAAKVVDTLQEVTGIECDVNFTNTHLLEYEGFEKNRESLSLIRRIMAPTVSEAEANILGQAAYTGTGNIDEETVIPSLKAAVDRRQDILQKGEQLTMPDHQEDNNSGDEIADPRKGKRKQR